MIPQTPSTTVPSGASAEQLLRLGEPFVAFPRFSILEIQKQRSPDGNQLPFSEWLTKSLQNGKPFVISDFDRLEDWPRLPADVSRPNESIPSFSIERLIALSTKKNIPIRNCSTGRDLSFTLRKFADSARNSYPEFQCLYARDLQCPQEWLEQCRKLLPTEVQWGGRLDLFQWLPACARSEVMMAYVGSEGSCSGFHRCFSSTVALNFLVDKDDERPVVCIGTDFHSQQKYDAFMSVRGISPHLDWHNLGMAEMRSADFPLYVCDQKVGDLVVLPPATAHQIWNPSTLTTKLVWNILHPLSLEVGIKHVQPPFNRLCHPDVARTNLSLACAMLSLIQDTSPDAHPLPLPPDLPLLSRLFRNMLHEESIEVQRSVTPVTLVTLGDGVIATCNFCSTAIWNRHVRCKICSDFDLCLSCYLNGRSCEHIPSYTWAELVPPDQCTRVLNRAREILGFQPEEPHILDGRKTLGTAVNDLMRAKLTSTSKLCHLCRIEHAEWRGQRCDRCMAFFCFRGMYRHFDVMPVDIIQQGGTWVCPKCTETCNCRCCHFATAYVKHEKPVSKRRVRATDPRGKVMGFADNVFDQKRGSRKENPPAPHFPAAPSTSRKRSLAPSEADRPPFGSPLKRMDLPIPQPPPVLKGENSDLVTFQPKGGINLPPLLPGTRGFSDPNSFVMSPGDDRTPRMSTAPSTPRFGPEAATNTLAPMLSRTPHPPPEAGPGSNRSPAPGSSSYVNIVRTSFVSEPANTSVSILQADARDLRPQPPMMSRPEAPADPIHSLDQTIARLEQQVSLLHQYDQEFEVLQLEDSRKTLREQIAVLEDEVGERKKQRAQGLVDRLQREGFSNLAAVVRKEVGIKDREAGVEGGRGVSRGRPSRSGPESGPHPTPESFFSRGHG